MHTHMFLFVTQDFWDFIVEMCFFVCNVGLFQITEWKPCMWLLNADILAGNATRQWHCWYRYKACIFLSWVKRSMSNSVAVLPQVWKIHC